MIVALHVGGEGGVETADVFSITNHATPIHFRVTAPGQLSQLSDILSSSD